MHNSSNDKFTVTYTGKVETSDKELRFEIFKFKKKEKRRSHTYKHFFNEVEFKNAWNKFTSKTLDDISKARKYLSQIYCPAIYNNSNACEYNCPSYNQCTYVINEFEKEYTDIVERIVKNSVDTPMFSVYHSNIRMNGLKTLAFLNNNTVYAQATALNGNEFNMATCYASDMPYESFHEFREKQIKRIKGDAMEKHTTWYSINTWGLAKEKITKSIKGQISHQPYKRGDSKGFRQYLDDVSDCKPVSKTKLFVDNA